VDTTAVNPLEKLTGSGEELETMFAVPQIPYASLKS
jgi:hypothetical protein